MNAFLFVLLAATSASSTPCIENHPVGGEIGIGRLICLGGDCTVNTPDAGGSYRHTFSREPRVAKIRRGSPSDGRLREGDAIVAIDEVPITTADGGRRLANLTPGKPVHLLMRRDGKTFNASITPVSGCNTPDLVVTGGSGGVQEVEQVVRATEAMRATPARPAIAAAIDFGMDLSCEDCGWRRNGTQTIWHSNGEPSVAAVAPNGPAAVAGVKPGDVLLDLAGHSFAGDSAAIATLRPGEAAVLRIRRGRETVTLTIIPRLR
jgi:S1-C subfamily serine protease